MVDDVVLVERVSIREQIDLHVLLRVSHGWLPRLEHVKSHFECLSVVHVFHILAGPAKGFPFGEFDAVEIDVVTLEKGKMLFRKIVTNDSNDMGRSKKARRDRSLRFCARRSLRFSSHERLIKSLGLRRGN